MFAFIAISPDQLKTLKSTADQVQNIRILLIIVLLYATLVGLINLLFYFFYKKSPDLRFSFLLPHFSSGKIKFEVEDNIGRPLSFTKCTIYKDEKIYKTVYPWTANFRVSLPPNRYKATISKFGYVAASTDEFEVNNNSLRFNLNLKATEDVADARHFGNLAYIIFALTLVLFAASISVYFLNFLHLDLPIQLVLLALSASSAYLSFRYYKLTRFIQARNFKKHLLKNEPIEIFGRDREPLKKVHTSKNGTLILLISPGLYKFSPEKYSPRTVRVFETCIGNFKVKF